MNSNTDRDHGDELEGAARKRLEASVEHLDAATLSRLNQARHRALDAVRERGPAGRRWWALPAGGLAIAVLAALLWWPQPEPAPISVMEDMEILASADSLEMLQDLEFFLWLEQTADDAG